jgi:hypothetical protein
MIKMYNNDGWPNLDEEFCIWIFYGTYQQLTDSKHMLLPQID